MLTRNRFIAANDEQNFFHQLGVGTGGSLGIGYSLTPFKNKLKVLDFGLNYQLANSRVEVNTIGNDNWRYGALQILLVANF